MQLNEFFTYLNGTAEQKQRFFDDNHLKIRCLKTADQAVSINGNTYVPVYNSETDTYISRDMEVLKKCPHCGNLEPADSFMTLSLISSDWYHANPSARRSRIVREITVCAHCADDISYVRPIGDDTDASAYAFTNRHEFISGINREGRKFWFINNHYGVYDTIDSVNHTWTVVSMGCENDGNFTIGRRDDKIAVPSDEFDDMTTPVTIVDGSSYQGQRIVPLLNDVLHTHADLFETCSQCHRTFLKAEHSRWFSNGDASCSFCHDIKIYNYHAWDGVYRTLCMPGENEIDTPQLGVEIETVGSRSNRRYVAPYREMWHLETDGSLPSESFEMISQKATPEYWKAHEQDVVAMLNALMSAGQKSHETSECGLHVHVSANAFRKSPNDTDEDVERHIQRAVLMVHVFRDEMEKFARRKSDQYYAYNARLAGSSRFVMDDYFHIDHNDHFCAVNVANHERARNSHGRNKKDTVEFRIFKGSLNPVTLYATLEFVLNIVAAANSDKAIIHFGDLLKGDHIAQYIAQRHAHGVDFNKNAVCSFIYAEMHEMFEHLCDGAMTIDEFTVQYHQLTDDAAAEENSADAISITAVAPLTADSDNSEETLVYSGVSSSESDSMNTAESLH